MFDLCFRNQELFVLIRKANFNSIGDFVILMLFDFNFEIVVASKGDRSQEPLVSLGLHE